MAYRNILDQIKWADLGRANFSGLSQGFIQARAQQQRQQEREVDAKAQQAAAAQEQQRYEAAQGLRMAQEGRAQEAHQQQTMSRQQQMELGAANLQQQQARAQQAQAIRQDEEKLRFFQGMTETDQPEAVAREIGATQERLAQADQGNIAPSSSLEGMAALDLASKNPGMGLRHQRFASEHPDWVPALARAKREKMALKRAGASSVSVTQGGQPLGSKARAESEMKVISGAETLGALRAIGKTAKADYFTRVGRARGWALDQISHVMGADTPKDWSEEVQARQQLGNEMDQFFNAYRKHITGAAGAEKEMAQIKESMLNKEISWPQYLGSIEQLKNKVTRDVRLHNRLLQRGIPKGTDPNMVMSTMLMTDDQFNSAEDAKARWKQLERQGMTKPKEIAEVLQAEGYRVE